MTSIKGWNGSAWVQPEYCVETSGTDTWKKYAEPIAGEALYDWDFSTAEDWYTNDDAGGFPDIECNGNEIIMRCPSPFSSSYSGHAYSPYLSHPDLPKGNFYAEASVRAEVYSLNPGCTATFIFQLAYSSAHYEWVQHDFTSSFGNIVFRTPVLNNSWLYNAHIDMWGGYNADAGNGGPNNYAICVDWCRIMNADGTIASTPSVPGFIPKYWNGSSWVAQNSA